MASVRRLVAAATADDLATLDIRKVETFSIVNLWAGCVTLTDTIRLAIGKLEIMPSSIMNIRAAAISVVLIDQDQLVFDTIVGPGVGDLRIEVVTLTTSLIYHLSVEPAIG